MVVALCIINKLVYNKQINKRIVKSPDLHLVVSTQSVCVVTVLK